jgi:predicted ATPase/class 3 adenylate cyclase
VVLPNDSSCNWCNNFLPMDRPSGTVTFLFTDIVGSTRLWEADPAAMSTALERHDLLLRSAIAEHGGRIFSTSGDGLAAAFARAGDALRAAVDAQAHIESEQWPHSAVIRVRMALHTGEVVERDGDYFGTAVNQAARIMALGHGGQILCSGATAGLTGEEVALVDLGEHRLRDISAPQRVFQVGTEAFPELHTRENSFGNLPNQLNSFVGRGLELADVTKTIRSERLVTLTGPGGVGKTRLGLEAAAQIAPDFIDGTWLIELAGLADGAEVPAAVAAVLGTSQQPGRSLWGSVCDGCRYRQTLLMFDNAEHIVDEMAALTVELLSTAPGVKVLVTSREALATPGEQIYPVRPLPVEDEAVALFAERARAVRPNFTVVAENARAVSEVCRHLDGIPLAIELAAARVESMTPEEISGRLDERFRLLRAGRRTRVERHQTLRATIDWSHDGLDEAERAVFAELAVFPASFASGAAQAVLANSGRDEWEALEALESLVAKSLLTANEEEGITRYQMLETVRHYANERLSERGGVSELRRAHSAWVADFVEREAIPGLRGPNEVLWVRRVMAERDSIVAAVDWAQEAGDVDAAVIFAGVICDYASIWRFGLADVPASVLGMPGIVDHPLYPDVAGAAAATLYHRGLLDDAIDLAYRAVKAERPDHPPAVIARRMLAQALINRGDQREALNVATDLLQIANAWGDPWVQVACLTTAVAVRLNDPSRNLDEVRSLALQAFRTAHELGNPTAIMTACFGLGYAESEHDPQSAIAPLCQSIEAAELVRASLWVVLAGGYLCRSYAALGEPSLAISTMRTSVAKARESGSRAMLAQILDYGGQALVTLAHDEEGCVFLSAAKEGQIATRASAGKLFDDHMAALEEARGRLGSNRYDEAVAKGQTMTADSAMTYAMETLERLGHYQNSSA